MLDRRKFLCAGAGLALASGCASTGAAKAPPVGPGPEMTSFIQGLPKGEMHLHLEGTLEAEMKFALAKRNNIALPYASVAEMQKSYIFTDLPSFLKIYYEGMTVLREEQDFYDLCYAYLAKAHSQNVLYTEMFFDPQAHLARGVTLDKVIPGFTRARAVAEQRLGIKSKLILCIMRDLDKNSAETAFDAATPYLKDIVAIGLDSDEKGNPPSKFHNVFLRARAAGLKVTGHCDIDQENTHAHIKWVLEELKPDRIDHGGNILQRPDLVAIAKARNMAFTVCPVFSG
jgi:adenosine deaminase